MDYVFFLSLSLKGIKLNIAYATWWCRNCPCCLSFLFYFHEQTTGLQIFGITLIVVGVIIANLAGGH